MGSRHSPGRCRAILVTGVIALLLAGCGQGSSTEPGDRPATGAAGSKSGPCCTGAPSTKAVLEAGQTPVDLKVVKLDQFIQALESYKGKIVVVDIWASWCVPCKKEFPHLVELHQKRAKEGVVCVSLTVDTPDAKETALEFLRSKGATFPNFLLDEPEEVWGNKWKIKGIPVVLVYGRDGELARKFDYDDPDNQFTYDDVNKFLDTLLAAKP